MHLHFLSQSAMALGRCACALNLHGPLAPLYIEQLQHLASPEFQRRKRWETEGRAEGERLDALLNPELPALDILLHRFKADIYRRDLWAVDAGEWLNDEAINCFGRTVLERARRHERLWERAAAADERGLRAAGLRRPARIFVHQSLFWQSLMGPGGSRGYNYDCVKRWTTKKRVDIFALDKIFYPLNVGGVHWVLVVADMQRQKLQFLDSLGGGGTAVTDKILRYLTDEYVDKKVEEREREAFDREAWASRWEVVPRPPDLPVQSNNYDCGAFVCMYMDYLSEDFPFDFREEDLAHHRRRIQLTIMRGELA